MIIYDRDFKIDDGNNKKVSKENKGSISIILMYLLTLMFGMVFGMLTMTFLEIRSSIVSGNSMNNTLNNGDKVMEYRTKGKLKRGDIVSVKGYINGENATLIKRVIALPKEEISIKNDKVYINEKILKETYIMNIQDERKLQNQKHYKFLNVKLKEDEYFVMGDNREKSLDSRVFGPVKRVSISSVIFKVIPKK